MSTIVPDITGENRDGAGRFKPGSSGNASGRPLGSLSITQAIKEKLKRAPRGQEKNYLQLLVDQVVKKALAGDTQMIRQIWEHIDGRPVQSVVPGGEGFTPYIIQIREAKKS